MGQGGDTASSPPEFQEVGGWKTVLAVGASHAQVVSRGRVVTEGGAKAVEATGHRWKEGSTYRERELEASRSMTVGRSLEGIGAEVAVAKV